MRKLSPLLLFLVVASALLVLLTSCATPYQPMGALGGYQEEQLAPDIFRVAFFGNGYTVPQTAAEYVIHRCAELTEQKGFRYFGITRSQRSKRNAYIYDAGTGDATAIGNTAFGIYHATTYYTPGANYPIQFSEVGYYHQDG